MKQTIKTLAACGALALSFAASAQSRHHYEEWHQRHVNVVRSSNSDNAIGALLLGGVIGAVIANNTRQQEQQVVVVPPQPVCYERPLYDQQGRFVMYQKVCQR